jgi:hypothetical protein
MHQFQLDVGFRQNRLREAVLLLEQSRKQMFDFQLLLPAASRQRLGGAKALLKSFCEAIEVHIQTSDDPA